jgi:hypothetical protein
MSKHVLNTRLPRRLSQGVSGWGEAGRRKARRIICGTCPWHVADSRDGRAGRVRAETQPVCISFREVYQP